VNDFFKDDQALFSISVVTELTGVSQQALRGYEDNGLIAPRRTKGGTRRYSRDDVERVTEIAALVADGVNLAGVEEVLKLRAEAGRLRRELDQATGDGAT
jgi:MerR family transcriptional regulator, heat shock protein HspR